MYDLERREIFKAISVTFDEDMIIDEIPAPANMDTFGGGTFEGEHITVEDIFVYDDEASEFWGGAGGAVGSSRETESRAATPSANDNTTDSGTAFDSPSPPSTEVSDMNYQNDDGNPVETMEEPSSNVDENEVRSSPANDEEQLESSSDDSRDKGYATPEEYQEEAVEEEREEDPITRTSRRHQKLSPEYGKLEVFRKPRTRNRYRMMSEMKRVVQKPQNRVLKGVIWYPKTLILKTENWMILH